MDLKYDTMIPESIATPQITIASTASITANNDGFVPSVNGSNMHSESIEVTFVVENGFWKDGTSDDIVVKAEGYEGEGYSVNLRDEQIPDVGDNPADGFKKGSWDIIPTKDIAITSGLYYTYTYAPKTDPKVIAPIAKADLVFSGSAQ